MALPELSNDGTRNTPTILYTWAGVIAAFLAVSALLSFLAVQTMSSSGDRIINSTGPVVISTQGLIASLAEADAANTAVFLSGLDGGDEDVSQRRLYESAIARAPQQIEDISAGIDDDRTHDALKEVAVQLTEYAGAVERARLSNSAGLPGANEELEASLALTGGSNGLLIGAEQVTALTRAQFIDDLSAGRVLVIAALAVLVLTLILLIVAQMRLRRLTKRLFNEGLLLATILVIALVGWLAVASTGRVLDLDAAEDEVVNDISLTAELQSLAFQYKTQETSAIIGENAADLPDPASLADIDQLIGSISVDADSPREEALATEVAVRWGRYLGVSDEISANVSRGNFDEARSQVGGDGNQNFNGFNTTLEALVLTNQEQFNTSVTNADARLAWLSYAALILPLLAAVSAWLGYRPRINEYF